MKFLKKLACATAVAMSVAGGAHAATVLNNWVFNPTGGGFSSGQRVNEYLDVNGNAFIQLNPTGGSSFSFTEHGVFNIVQADSKGALFPVNYPGGNITATLEASGTGNFSGAFTFTGGTIRMYQNPTNNQYATSAGIYGADLGNQIAEFTVMARAEAGSLDAGYFFRENGQDLSTESIMAFAFTNANTIANPDETLVSEVACQYAGFTGPGCGSGTYANTPGYFFVSNNGQFKLAEVPEPGSLALFGIAMLGAGVVSRKRAKKA